MSWLVLILSGMFEAVWAIALDRTEGFSRWQPTLVFFAALVVSMGGLGWAMRELPVGTAYAVWVAVGATLTVVWSMATGEEPLSVARVLLVAGIIGCVIGLKVID